HLGLLKAFDRLLRRADDRLVLIERRIENHRHARELRKVRNQLIITLVDLSRDGLQTPGAVDVSHGWNLGPAFLPDLVDHQHSRRWMRLFKVVTDTLFQNRRRKRSKRFTLLDAIVQDLFHLSTAWIDDDRPVAKRAWSKLHPALKPSDHQPRSNILGSTSGDYFVRVRLER